MRPIFTVAKNEFSMVVRNPITCLVCGFIIIYLTVNIVGSTVIVPQFASSYSHNDAFYINISNSFWLLTTFFAFLSMCIGIITIAKERSSGSLRVLTAKPLYRRDIITGKFLGLSLFLLLLMILTEIVFISLIIIVLGSPDSLLELVLRLSSFIVLLFLNCSFTLGLVMLFGIVFNKAEALILSMAFVSFEWLQQASVDFQFLGQIQQLIDPMKLYFNTIFVFSGNETLGSLFETRLSFDAWLNHALPFVVLMLAEVILIVLINSAMFSKEEM